MAKSSYSYTLGRTWVKVADAGDTIVVDVRDGQVLRAFGASAPTGLVGHVQSAEDPRAMVAAVEDVWLRAYNTASAVVLNDDVGSGSGNGATTSETALSEAWVQVAAAANTFVELENKDGVGILWWVGAQPAAGSMTGHLLRPGDGWEDPLNNANIWARSIVPSKASTARITVSKG